jgi:hypothetical protein
MTGQKVKVGTRYGTKNSFLKFHLQLIRYSALECFFVCSSNAIFSCDILYVQIGIPVRGGTGAVVDFCLAKWWANLGLVDAHYTITFQGLLPNPSRTSKHTIMPVGQSESIK